MTPEAAAARQRLEFLGDAAWDFAVAAAAYRTWRQASSGDLTRFRATWCSAMGLAALAREIGLPVPSGPSAPAPSERVLAELLEAILGAVVEDGGLEAILTLAQRIVLEEGLIATSPPIDPKSALQMLVQARFGSLPIYRLVERRGPPHQPTFRVTVRVHKGEEAIQTEAEGGSRQAAEQEAARLALQQLESLPPPDQDPEHNIS